jgi:hypothetical protein
MADGRGRTMGERSGRPARRVSIPRTVDHSGAPAPRVTKDVLTYWLDVPRSTIPRAVGDGRSLSAERGCTVEGRSRLHALADVVAYLATSMQRGLLDATEVPGVGVR